MRYPREQGRQPLTEGVASWVRESKLCVHEPGRVVPLAATGAFGERSIQMILVRILFTAVDSNRDFSRTYGGGEHQTLLSGVSGYHPACSFFLWRGDV